MEEAALLAPLGATFGGVPKTVPKESSKFLLSPAPSWYFTASNSIILTRGDTNTHLTDGKAESQGRGFRGPSPPEK